MSGVEIDDRYKESDEHQPRLTDQTAFLNTTGIGNSDHRIEEISPVFEVDKVKTAEEILGALDPENTKVSSDRVMLPDADVVVRDDDAADQIKKAAEARVERGVVVGGLSPAQEEAAEEGEEGVDQAVEGESQNAIVGGEPHGTSPTREQARDGDSGDQGSSGPGGGNTASTSDSDDDEATKGQQTAKKQAASSTAKKTASSR